MKYGHICVYKNERCCTMEEIISVIDGYAEIFPKWFIIAYLLFLVTGVITACTNKKNFNRVFWLIIVIVFPFYGTAASVICCIIMSKISKSKSVNLFDYPLEKNIYCFRLSLLLQELIYQSMLLIIIKNIYILNGIFL